MINKYTLNTCNESETNLNETKTPPGEKHENVRYKKGQVMFVGQCNVLVGI